MEELDYRAILRKINGNFAKVINEDSGRLFTKGRMDYHEEIGEIEIGDHRIPLSSLSDLCLGCEGSSPIIFIDGKYEAAATR